MTGQQVDDTGRVAIDSINLYRDTSQPTTVDAGLPGDPGSTPIGAIWAMRVCSLVALTVAGYLSFKAYHGSPILGCQADGIFDCSHVLSSRWSRWLGVPVSVPALANYIFLLAALGFVGKRASSSNRRLAWALVTIAGLAAGLAALWFIALQGIVLGTWCKYCMVAHTMGLIIAGILLRYRPLGNQTAFVSAAPVLGIVVLIAGQVMYEPTTISIENYDDAGQVVDTDEESMFLDPLADATSSGDDDLFAAPDDDLFAAPSEAVESPGPDISQSLAAADSVPSSPDNAISGPADIPKPSHSPEPTTSDAESDPTVETTAGDLALSAVADDEQAQIELIQTTDLDESSSGEALPMTLASDVDLKSAVIVQKPVVPGAGLAPDADAEDEAGTAEDGEDGIVTEPENDVLADESAIEDGGFPIPSLSPPAPTPTATATPIQAEKPKRLVPIVGGRARLNVYDWPIMGSPDATHVIIELFDYTCPFCRKMCHQLETAKQRFGDQLAIITLPVPLSHRCNETVTRTTAEHAEACELSQAALAVWRVDASQFEAFHQWLFASSQPRSAADAKSHARSLVDAAAFDREFDGSVVPKYIAKHVAIYKMIGQGTVPALLFSHTTIRGKTGSADDLCRLLEQQLGITAQ